MEIEGKVIAVLQPITGNSAKGAWKKQEIVIETLGNFPKKVMMSAWGQKAESIANLQIGATVRASIELESREYNGRWYTDVRITFIEPLLPRTEADPVAAPAYDTNSFGTTFTNGNEEEDYVF